ncbi:Transposon TX1 protein [Smittium culicis]|uniref:Transposon TX1 protein n=1 Tax=Smittium culicis TaxID=133412 RepID=A0A1R1X771_9FUNG|nr:Transposon TX1 protein [Smittium culicis]
MKMIANQLIFNDFKKLWNFIKSYTGESFKNIAYGPVYNKNKNFITDKINKIKIWANHFGELALDATGNSRSTDKWENLIISDCDYYPECDNSILWSDITHALEDTPNNKTPGTDGVPSENKETWLCYIDYSKAYERVPHMALVHKLRSVDFGGKLLNMIKGMYDAPKIAVRVGNEVSNPTEYLCGVRQGCPASPILFDFYINDIFKGVRGVRVPGLTTRLPGLLFADDAVLLAESSADLQTALNTITEWSDTW